MSGLLTQPGFLGTHAPFISDLSLVLILFSSALFTLGYVRVRQQHTQTHHWIQMAAALINAVVVIGFMIRSFDVNILPGLPKHLFQGSYGITTLHATVGSIALLMGIYVVLSTNKLLPKKWRFNNYKPYMRTSYALYMAATLLGIIVYVETFVIGI